MALFPLGSGSQLLPGLGAGRCLACEVSARKEDHRKYLKSMDQEGGPRKCYYELSVPSHMHNDAGKIRLSEICKALLLKEEYGNAQKHCTGPEEALDVQSGPQWETNSQKVYLGSGGEEGEKNEFMVHVQFEARSQVPVLHPTSGCQRDSVQ